MLFRSTAREAALYRDALRVQLPEQPAAESSIQRPALSREEAAAELAHTQALLAQERTRFATVSYTHLLQRTCVRPSMRFYSHFSQLMVRSPGFGSMASNFLRPIQTRSRFASGTEDLKLARYYNSPDRSDVYKRQAHHGVIRPPFGQKFIDLRPQVLHGAVKLA